MKRSRIVALVVAAVTLLALAAVYRLTGPPETYRSAEGPSTETLSTSGVFKPGGYVDFEFSPGVESLGEHYQGSVIVYAVSPDNLSIDAALWTTHIDLGSDWPDTLSGGADAFVVKHRVAIPDDRSFAGEPVVFLLEYRLHYPVSSGAAPGVGRSYFSQVDENFDESIQIDISDEVLTAEETTWKGEQTWERDVLTQAVMAVLLTVGITALWFVVVPWRGGRRA